MLFTSAFSGCLSAAFRYRNLCCLQEGGWVGAEESRGKLRIFENWGRMMVGRFFPRQDLCQARQLNDRTKRSKIEKPRRCRSQASVQPQAIQGVTPPLRSMAPHNAHWTLFQGCLFQSSRGWIRLQTGLGRWEKHPVGQGCGPPWGPCASLTNLAVAFPTNAWSPLILQSLAF